MKLCDNMWDPDSGVITVMLHNVNFAIAGNIYSEPKYASRTARSIYDGSELYSLVQFSLDILATLTVIVTDDV